MGAHALYCRGCTAKRALLEPTACQLSTCSTVKSLAHTMAERVPVTGSRGDRARATCALLIVPDPAPPSPPPSQKRYPERSCQQQP